MNMLSACRRLIQVASDRLRVHLSDVTLQKLKKPCVAICFQVTLQGCVSSGPGVRGTAVERNWTCSEDSRLAVHVWHTGHVLKTGSRLSVQAWHILFYNNISHCEELQQV